MCYAFLAGLLPGMLGIVSNVQEKPAPGHAAPPSAPAGGAAFPKATHRKLSKVIKVTQAVQIGMHPCPVAQACGTFMCSLCALFTVRTVRTQGGNLSDTNVGHAFLARLVCLPIFKCIGMHSFMLRR